MHTGIMSLESIAFQSTAFYDDLTKIVTQLRETPVEITPTEFFATPAALEILSSIKAHTGLRVLFDKMHPAAPPCMIFPVYTINHVHIRDDERERLSAAIDVAKAVAAMKQNYVGKIDLVNAKVTGDFCKIDHLLYLPYDILVKGLWLGQPFTPREVAAMVLHEVGHAFVNLEYMNRLVTTNQVLAGVSQVLLSNQPEEIELVISTAIMRMQANPEQAKALRDVKSAEGAGIVLATIAVDQSRSELGHSVFDENSMETLCDQFAARHGAAKDLVLGLAKVAQRNPQASYWYRYFIDVSVFALCSVIAVPAVLVLGLTYKRGPDPYGSFHGRMTRLRNEIVAQLKDRTLTPLEKSSSLDALDEVNALLATESNRLNFYEGLLYLINGDYRANRKYEMLQRQLEAYTHNAFFGQAAKFSSL